MSLRDNLRLITRRIAPAFLAGVVLLAAVSCGKNIDNSVRQLQIDQKKIAQYLDEHCLTPAGEIVPLAEVPALNDETEGDDQGPTLPEGYVVLSDTAQSRGNMYIIPLKEGAGDTPTATDKVLIRYRGYYLETMQEFDSTWDDPEPYPVWISGVIEGLRTGLLAMKTGIVDPEQAGSYLSPGEAWMILPSTLAFGQEGKTSPTVPPNTCVIYRVNLYGIVPLTF